MKTSIPLSFLITPYDAFKHPQNSKRGDLVHGANCQHFVYEVLRHLGHKIGNFRSSELWDDTSYTKKIKKLAPLDILFFNKNEDAYGAHIALYLGNDRILHLSKEVQFPAIWSFSDFQKRKRYKNLIGAKRLK